MIGVDEPERFWQPWVGHWFPGITPARMIELTVFQYLAMYRFAKDSSGN